MYVSKKIYDGVKSGKYSRIIREIERTFKTEIHLSDFDSLEVCEEDVNEGIKEKVSFWCPASFCIHGKKFYIQTEAEAWIYEDYDFFIQLNPNVFTIKTDDYFEIEKHFTDIFDLVSMVSPFWNVETWGWCVKWWQSFEHKTEETQAQ